MWVSVREAEISVAIVCGEKVIFTCGRWDHEA